MMADREFNTFGPVDPRFHYHVDRVAVKAAIRQKIEKGRYFTLNAARQTGKTTLFREVMTGLEETGDYFSLLLSFETLRGFNRAEFYEQLGRQLNRTLPTLQQLTPHTSLPSPLGLRHHGEATVQFDRVINGRQILAYGVTHF